MTRISQRLARLIEALDRHPASWLALGAALLALSHFRFGIGALGWIAPIPLLRHVRVTSGWRARLAFLMASLAGWVLALAKIATPPLSPLFAVSFALPVGVLLTFPYVLMPHVRRLGEGASVLAFAALMVTGEWALHTALPFGTWGAAAHTQIESLALLQLASVTGIHGVSALVYLVAASAESWLHDPGRRAPFVAAAMGVLVVVGGGQARLAAATAAGSANVRVAAVGTDSMIGAGPIPDDAELARVEAGLFERTRAAARAGASMVVWTEAATMVHPADESAFLARVGGLARDARLTVVAGYIVPHSLTPLRYANRYALLAPDGTIDHVYDKRHPVPGEPAAPGTGPLPVYVGSELGRVSGALCYDYDFPRLGLEHARLGVDLVALPSSDWRGIDPIHTQMAAIRAIEGGQSVLRSTRFGLSAGIDPHGRMRGWLSHWDEGDRVLVVSLPRHRVTTLYALGGDWFPIASVLFGLLALVAASIRRSRWYAARSPWTPSSRSRVAPSSTPASASASTRPSS